MELTINETILRQSLSQLIKKSDLLVQKSAILQRLYYCHAPEERQKLWAEFNALKQFNVS